MTKYNKNLYSYAISDVLKFKSDWPILIFIFASMMYNFVVLIMNFISSLVMVAKREDNLQNYTDDALARRTQGLNNTKIFAIWVGIAIALLIASFVLVLIKKVIPAFIVGTASSAISVVYCFGETGQSVFISILWTFFIPAILVFLFLVIYLVIYLVRQNKVKKRYNELSSMIYEKLKQKSIDKSVNQKDYIKAMDEYNGK